MFQCLYLYLFQTLFFSVRFILGNPPKFDLLILARLFGTHAFTTHELQRGSSETKKQTTDRWWFQTFFCSPLLGERIQFDEYFEIGWNHQPDHQTAISAKRWEKTRPFFSAAKPGLQDVTDVTQPEIPYEGVEKTHVHPVICKAKLHRRPKWGLWTNPCHQKEISFPDHDMKRGYFNALKQQILPVCSSLLMLFFLFMAVPLMIAGDLSHS